jgi:hypothetical protein
MLDVIGPLTGFSFSGQPTELGWNPGHVTRAWSELMQRLGQNARRWPEDLRYSLFPIASA